MCLHLLNFNVNTALHHSSNSISESLLARLLALSGTVDKRDILLSTVPAGRDNLIVSFFNGTIMNTIRLLLDALNLETKTGPLSI